MPCSPPHPPLNPARRHPAWHAFPQRREHPPTRTRLPKRAELMEARGRAARPLLDDETSALSSRCAVSAGRRGSSTRAALARGHRAWLGGSGMAPCGPWNRLKAVWKDSASSGNSGVEGPTSTTGLNGLIASRRANCSPCSAATRRRKGQAATPSLGSASHIGPVCPMPPRLLRDSSGLGAGEVGVGCGTSFGLLDEQTSGHDRGCPQPPFDPGQDCQRVLAKHEIGGPCLGICTLQTHAGR